MTKQLLEAYMRPCWICGATGTCPDREPAVELAYLNSEPIVSKPPARELAAPERRRPHA